MKMISTFARVLLLATSLGASVAYADILLDVTGAVLATDATQLGRLSRGGTPQNWGGIEALPPVINTTTTYHYITYTVNVGALPFIQIDFDSTSANTFVAAFQGAYNPVTQNTNWIGDEGGSGNFFGTDVSFFDVKAAPNSIITIVVDTTGGGALGTGDPFHLIVEGYISADFAVPEPSPLLLCFLPLLALLGREAWKRRGDTRGRLAM